MSNIFDVITNENFFRPLCSKNRVLYYDCICELINISGSNISILDSDARDCINIYLNNSRIEYVNDTDEEAYSISKNGNDIIRYFRMCGWMSEKELGGGSYITRVEPLCIKLISHLKEITEKESSGDISNHIFDMYDILNVAFNDTKSGRQERPYANILKPLMDNEERLKEKLAELNISISRIMTSIMDTSSINELGNYLAKDKLLEEFFSDYYFIKHNGTIPIVVGQISDYLSRLRDDEWVNKIAENYSKVKKIAMEDSISDIKNILYELQFFISNEYFTEMDVIENQINKYFDLAHAKLMLFSLSGFNLETAIDQYLRQLKTAGESYRNESLLQLKDASTIIAQKYIGMKSFSIKTKVQYTDKTTGLSIYTPTEEDLAKWKAELEWENNYTRKKVSSYVNQKMKKRDKLELKYERIRSREDIQMFVAAASMSELSNFPYHVTIMNEMIDLGFAEVSNIIIERKESK